MASGTGVRLAPPAPLGAAAGGWCWRHGGGVGQRCAQTVRVCGWRRPRPAGLRLAIGPWCGGGEGERCSRATRVCGWQVVHSAASNVSTRQHKLHAPSRVASHDAQVREGPGAAVRSDWPSFVHTCAALPYLPIWLETAPPW
jgi:hypothetical protein